MRSLRDPFVLKGKTVTRTGLMSSEKTAADASEP